MNLLNIKELEQLRHSVHGSKNKKQSLFQEQFQTQPQKSKLKNSDYKYRALILINKNKISVNSDNFPRRNAYNMSRLFYEQ